MLYFDYVTNYLNRGNEEANIRYIMNYIKGIWAIKRGFITLDELEKLFHMFLNSMD